MKRMKNLEQTFNFRWFSLSKSASVIDNKKLRQLTFFCNFWKRNRFYLLMPYNKNHFFYFAVFTTGSCSTFCRCLQFTVFRIATFDAVIWLAFLKFSRRITTRCHDSDFYEIWFLSYSFERILSELEQLT